MEISEENLKLAESLGYDAETAKEIFSKAGQANPSLQIPDIEAGKKEGEKVAVTFATNEVKTIQVKGPDPKNPKKVVEKQAQITTVTTQDGINRTLWLTSESMKRAYLQIRALHPEGIKGKKALIYKAKVLYPTGEGIAYRIQDVDSEQLKRIEKEEKIEKAAEQKAEELANASEQVLSEQTAGAEQNSNSVSASEEQFF